MKKHIKINLARVAKILRMFVLVLLLFACTLSFLCIAQAEQIDGLWAGGSEILFQIYKFNSDKTGSWTVANITYENMLVLNGTWTSNGNKVVFTTSESGKMPLIGNLSVSFDKNTKKELILDNNILTDINDQTQLIKLP